MAAAVVGYAAISSVSQKKHLILKGIRAQGPAMTEDHGLSRSPILVVNLSAVFHCNRTHNSFSSIVNFVADGTR
jgi:hypothetical protein